MLGCSLETSLVEWKRTCVHTGSIRVGALETSLVEWKHHEPPEQRIMKAALETSLVEWKRVVATLNAVSLGTLETSLVEWKQHGDTNTPHKIRPLGNFLSGMETNPGGRDAGRADLPWKLP